MSAARGRFGSRPAPDSELAEVRMRLAEAEKALRAIRSGEVDTLVVAGKKGRQVFTLQGAERAYRLLIESMNEGALTLTTDKMILYANACFSKMVKCPLKQVIGGSFRRFLSAGDLSTLRSLLKRSVRSGAKIRVRLHAADGSQMPVQISLRTTPRHGIERATIGMVLTDLTESRRAEERLRALAHRVVSAQEDERGRVALELHDGITQLLCGMQFRSQALLASLSVRDGPARREARKLRDMAGSTAKEVARISQNLHPGVLDRLGLVAVLRDASEEFTNRTGVKVVLTCAQPAAPLSADTELALYRIFQEALRNVEKHSRARHIAVGLAQQGVFVHLSINDDGIGFDLNPASGTENGRRGLGLFGMRERATYVGGTLTIKSTRRTGTEIAVNVPVTARAASPPAIG